MPQRSWSESSLEPSEALALVLQLFSGPLADRSGRYWSLTILGYTMTPVCVPLLAAVPFVDSLGLALAATLILLERAGKAIRSPSKSALLARVAGAVGSGRGFAVQKAMDQVEAFAGPVLVAAVTGMQWPAFAVLAIPGAACMLLLFTLKRHSGERTVRQQGHRCTSRHRRFLPSADTTRGRRRRTANTVGTVLRVRDVLRPQHHGADDVRGDLVHLVDASLVSTAVVPLIYAAAMGLKQLQPW